MAMHIDMNPYPDLWEGLRTQLKASSGGRFDLSRVCVRASAFDTAEVASSTYFRPKPRRPRSSLKNGASCEEPLNWREALNWQADPDDELEEWQVHRNLERLAADVDLRRIMWARRLPVVGTRTFSTSAQFPTVSTLAHGRTALSSFRRHSYRALWFLGPDALCIQFMRPPVFWTDSHVLPVELRSAIRIYKRFLSPDRRGAVVSHGGRPVAAVQLQLDFVDLGSLVRPPPWRPGKRRRGPLHPILEESPRPLQEHTSKHADHSHRASFEGVRCRNRSGRKRWTAEMRMGQNKEWIGDFESGAQAARAADAAHFYFDRSDLLNFPDAPQLLSERPSPSAPLTDAAEKLRFVKQEAKWLASIAPSRPSSPCSTPSLESLEPSQGCVAANLEFRPLSEICTEPAMRRADQVYDAISHVQESIQVADSGGNGILIMDHDMVAAFELQTLEDLAHTRVTESLDAMDIFQIADQAYPHRSPSPAAQIEMWLGHAGQGRMEELVEQETEEIWS